MVMFLMALSLSIFGLAVSRPGLWRGHSHTASAGGADSKPRLELAPEQFFGESQVRRSTAPPDVPLEVPRCSRSSGTFASSRLRPSRSSICRRPKR